MPIFGDSRGLNVDWYSFVMTTGVVHKDSAPIEGHYQCILWHSGTALECADFRDALPLGSDPIWPKISISFWIVPSRLTNSL